VKYFFFLNLLSFFISCSHHRIDRRLGDNDIDFFHDESLLRWSKNKLISGEFASRPIASCHLGDTFEALNNLKSDFIKKQTDQNYWIHLGNCFFLKEDWGKAEFYYHQAYADATVPAMKALALNNLALLQFKFKLWEVAEKNLINASSLLPKSKVPRFNLAQLYLHLGHYDKALLLLNDKSLFNVGDSDITYSLANAYLFKGDLPNAKKYFDLLPPTALKREDIALTYTIFLLHMDQIQMAKSFFDNRNISGIVELKTLAQFVETKLNDRLIKE